MDAYFQTAEGAAIIERAHDHLKKDTYPSIAALDRRLSLGYSMASKILYELERRGIVSAVQTDGARRYLGEGAEARRAYEALAAEINAGLSPVARWWRGLSPAKRRGYLPGVDESAQWSDLSARDAAKATSIYWRNKDKYSALRAEFAGVAA